MVKTLLTLLLLLPSLALAEVEPITIYPTNEFNIAGTNYRAGGVIAQNLYTNVSATTTPTGNVPIHFSTITVPADTLPRNGDSLIIFCEGTTGVSEQKTFAMTVNGVDVATKTAAVGGAIGLPWHMEVQITRTSAGNNILTCGPSNGPTINICSSAGMSYGLTTFNEATPLVISCSARSLTQGSISFMRHRVVYIPAP